MTGKNREIGRGDGKGVRKPRQPVARFDAGNPDLGRRTVFPGRFLLVRFFLPRCFGFQFEYRDASGGKWFDPATRTDSEPLQPDASAAAPEANAGYVARLQDNDVYLTKRSTAADAGGGRRGRRGSNATSGGDSETIQITKDGTDAPRKSEAHCNATGTRASYVMGGNLFVVEAATKEVWQVTSDGSEEMLHGVLDWVYQEEIYGRGDFQGHWWSPKGDLVALLSLDESKVR